MLYSFVIPTRERHDVLKGAIQSVLNQTRSNFEIVVMDNASSPETKRVAESFNSSHIRYFRAPERLAMTDNWELGLQHAVGDYITVLGDDDGALPDAVEIAEEIHARWPNTILTWKPPIYFWPNFFIETYRNLVHMHIGARVEERSTRGLLRDVYAARKMFDELPSLYDSFVPRSVIEKVRGKYGRYFLSLSPDVGSGLINAWSAESYIYSYRPLAVRGVSHHSTGTSYSFPHIQSGPAETFNKEVKGGAWENALHPKLTGIFITEVSIVNEFLHFKEKHFPDDREIKPDMKGFLRWFCQAAPRFMTRYEDVKTAIYDMAKKNGISTRNINIPPAWPSIERIGFYARMDDTGTVHFSYYVNPDFIKDIADFTVAAASMCVAKEDLVIKQAEPPRKSSRKLWARR
jgi:glycosyltransferase involved in cell wall biosynthesis